MMKGEFVDILKDIGDFEILDEFLEAQRRKLKNEGLPEQFLRNVLDFSGVSWAAPPLWCWEGSPFLIDVHSV